RLCPKGHVNLAVSRFCTTCGSSKLTKPTAWIPLSWLSFALTLVAIFAVVKIILYNSCGIICGSVSLIQWITRSLWSSTPLGLRLLFRSLMIAWVLCFAFSWLLPEKPGQTLRSWLIGLLRLGA